MQSKHLRINRVIFALSLIGIAIAVYVTQSFLRQSPIVCITSGCEAVRKSPASYLFGVIPVPAVGLVGYTILAIGAFLRTATTEQRLLRTVSRIMMGMSTFGVAFVLWFTYTELFVIHGICTWCAISTVNMCILWILTILTTSKQERIVA